MPAAPIVPSHSTAVAAAATGAATIGRRARLGPAMSRYFDLSVSADAFTQAPYSPPDAAQWLVERAPNNIGFDFFEEYCARLPDFSSEDYPMHRVILGAGVVIMEGLTNLGALPRRRVDFAAPFYKIAGTEGAPARFLAVVSTGA